MSSLNASLATALSGLTADQGALQATTNNVSNVNTPGYSREVPILISSDPIVMDPLTLGTGVTLKSIESIRDPILESRIQQETQTQGELSSLVGALSQTQVNFTSSTGDIGTSISNFFNSINQLSTNPADLSLRQAVLTSANNLATAFNVVSNNLTRQRTSLDGSVEQAVGQINQLTRQIAQLNGQISNLQNVGESAGAFIDQRTQAIDQLSSLVDVSVIPSDNTLTLTTASGSPLVLGQQSFQLSTQPGSSGLQHVFSQGKDVTATIVSGQLGGLLAARDQQIPSFQSQLDTLAAGLAVAITDPSLIAASADGTAGSNANAEAMYSLSSQAIILGQSPTDYYSSLVFNVGNAAANANAEQSASSLVLQQLNDLRSSISGVSLDQEAANLVQYQQAYSASAQVVSTINQMMQTVINMKSS
jgi:flagellar hook-associated protein 1 FlgK